ncbi:hypothetical protein [Polaribacter sp. SA4-10]|nr:hypothetical protein [Polaribacter sp. SA4-10]
MRGFIDVERAIFRVIIDYEKGACDHLATFTFINGTIRGVVLNETRLLHT